MQDRPELERPDERDLVEREADFDFEDYIDELHSHYIEHYARTGYGFERYRPAYRYGFDLAFDPVYRGRTWDEIEAEARDEWQAQQRGRWDEYERAVHEGWDVVHKEGGGARHR